MPTIRNHSTTRRASASTIAADHPTVRVKTQAPAAIASIASPSSPTSPTPTSRRKKDNYVRRPKNPFMFYRSYVYRTKQIAEKHQGNLSVVAARMWNDMNDEERAPFVELSEREKEEHRRLYPGYSFKPGRRQTVEEAMNTPPVARKERGSSRTAASASTKSRPRTRRLTTPPSPEVCDIDTSPESPVQGEIFPKPFEPPVLYLPVQQEYNDEVRSECGSSSSQTDTFDERWSPLTPAFRPFDGSPEPRFMQLHDTTLVFPDDGVVLTPEFDFESFIHSSAYDVECESNFWP